MIDMNAKYEMHVRDIGGNKKIYPARVICTDRKGGPPVVVLAYIGSSEYFFSFHDNSISGCHGAELAKIKAARAKV